MGKILIVASLGLSLVSMGCQRKGGGGTTVVQKPRNLAAEFKKELPPSVGEKQLVAAGCEAEFFTGVKNLKDTVKLSSKVAGQLDRYKRKLGELALLLPSLEEELLKLPPEELVPFVDAIVAKRPVANKVGEEAKKLVRSLAISVSLYRDQLDLYRTRLADEVKACGSLTELEEPFGELNKLLDAHSQSLDSLHGLVTPYSDKIDLLSEELAGFDAHLDELTKQVATEMSRRVYVESVRSSRPVLDSAKFARLVADKYKVYPVREKFKGKLGIAYLMRVYSGIEAAKTDRELCYGDLLPWMKKGCKDLGTYIYHYRQILHELPMQVVLNLDEINWKTGGRYGYRVAKIRGKISWNLKEAIRLHDELLKDIEGVKGGETAVEVDKDAMVIGLFAAEEEPNAPKLSALEALEGLLTEVKVTALPFTTDGLEIKIPLYVIDPIIDPIYIAEVDPENNFFVEHADRVIAKIKYAKDQGDENTVNWHRASYLRRDSVLRPVVVGRKDIVKGEMAALDAAYQRVVE